MSGHSVPYQLRTNKFVERQLYLDVLDFVRVWNGPAHYIYVSMGGPFLEDFRQVNERFAIENMVSLESHKVTWERQKFNSPFGFIDCRNQSTGDFITSFDAFVGGSPDSRYLIWLDYAAADERDQQLQEYEALVGKLAEGDVVKITMNANCYCKLQRSEYRQLTNKQFETLLTNELLDSLGDYVPAGGVQQEHLNPKGFAVLLARCIEMAANKATNTSELTVIPLLGCRYNDGSHQMVTITAMVANKQLSDRCEADQRFADWPFRAKEWRSVFEIDVPHLSSKERMAINHLLKTSDDAHAIHTALGIQFDDRIGESIAILGKYLKHYRRYPTFGRVQS